MVHHNSVGSRALACLLVTLCGACSGPGWDGRRGYDGRGDYGYDVNASSAEARSYRQRAVANYPAPGNPDDPWEPYIREAAYRFRVPERWVREVMQQESGGRPYDADGSLITSSAGAMGLMQVMPQTYDVLRQRYGLGEDPYEPHNNILAGTAYIREMYDRFGAPGFLAAYDAGPDRVDAYLSDGSPLPDETLSYLSSVAPRLGRESAMTGPLAAFAGATEGSNVGMSYAANRDLPSASGAITRAAYAFGGRADDDDPSLRAFDGGGLVTPAAPTGALAGQSSARIQLAEQPALSPVVVAATSRGGTWGIQVGAYSDPATSNLAIQRARAGAGDLLSDSQPTVSPVQHGTLLYRARLMGLSAAAASEACTRLAEAGLGCVALPPGS